MKSKGPWSRAEIQRFVEQVHIPIRLACNGISGHPVMASLWFLPENGRLWCATQRSAKVAALVSRNPNCAFEVSLETPPYKGIRGRGLATLHDDRGEEILRKLIDRYLGDSKPKFAQLLLARASTETAIAIEPQALVSWDFSERMGETG